MERIDYSENLEYDPSAQFDLTEAPSEKELIKAPFLENQHKLFHKRKAKFKIVAKGRRFGFTRGLALYVMERGMKGNESILWVDTSYSNITRYIERYFLPVLKQYPREYWEWKKTRSEMKIYGNDTETVIDFRSADRPENIEGFGYSLIVLNEAGIILKNERLWLESIRPMMLDYQADAIIASPPLRNLRLASVDLLANK